MLPESTGRDCLPVTVPAQLGAAAPGAGDAGAGAPQNFVLGKDGIPPPAMLDAVREALRIKPSAAQLVERQRAEEAGEPRTVALQHEKPAVLCGLDGLLQAVEGENAGARRRLRRRPRHPARPPTRSTRSARQRCGC